MDLLPMTLIISEKLPGVRQFRHGIASMNITVLTACLHTQSIYSFSCSCSVHSLQESDFDVLLQVASHIIVQLQKKSCLSGNAPELVYLGLASVIP